MEVFIIVNAIISLTAIGALVLQSYLQKQERDELTRKLMARNLTEYYTPDVIRNTEQPKPQENPYMSLTEMENDPIAFHKAHTSFTE